MTTIALAAQRDTEHLGFHRLNGSDVHYRLDHRQLDELAFSDLQVPEMDDFDDGPANDRVADGVADDRPADDGEDGTGHPDEAPNRRS